MRAALYAIAVLALAAGRPPAPQEPPALGIRFTLTDGTEVVGSIHSTSLSLETELGAIRIPSKRITGCHSEKSDWAFQLSQERIVGRLRDEAIRVSTASGPLEIPVARILRSTAVIPSAFPPASDLPLPAEILPLSTLSKNCSLSELMLAPDGSALYFLEATPEGQVLRQFNTDRQEMSPIRLKLSPDPAGLRITGDGESIVAFSRVRPATEGVETTSRILLIKSSDFSIRANFTVEYSIQELQPHRSGLFIVSGRGPRHETMAVVNPATSSVVAIWNLTLPPSSLRLLSDGRRAITSSLQDDRCAVLSLPEDLVKSVPAMWSFPRPRGGREFLTTPDDQHLVWQSGSIVRVAGFGETLRTVSQAPAHTLALSAQGGAVILLPMLDGRLERVSLPRGKALPSIRVGSPWYAAVIDSRKGRVYAATDRRDRRMVGAGQPLGDLCAFELQPLVKSEDPRAQGAVTIAPDGEWAPVRVHEISAHIRSLAVTGSPARFVLLNGTDNRVHSYAAASGDAVAVSASFPYSARFLIADDDRKVLHVLGAGPPEKTGTGSWFEVDSESLSIRSVVPLPFVPHCGDLDDDGRLFLTQEGGDRSQVWILDASKKSVVGRWALESDRVHLRISRAASSAFLAPPFRSFPIPPRDLPARPVLSRIPANLAGLTGDRFEVDPSGLTMLFESGAVLVRPSVAQADFRFAGLLPAVRAGAFLGRTGQFAVAEPGGRIRLVSLKDLSDLKVHRVDHPAYALIFDPASRMLCAASDAPPQGSRARSDSGIGPVVFYRVPE
jgi:hypothetical protein